MGSRAILTVFEKFQRERVAFASEVAELAKNPQNVEALQQVGAMALLRPLLLDKVPSIQQSAAVAMGRLANHNEEMAEAIVQNQVLPDLVASLATQNRFYRRAAAGCLKAVAKHSAPLAQATVDCGAIEALVACLEDFDPGVKEAATWCLGYIASHNPDLARQVLAAGAVPLVVLTGQEPELFLKRIAASTISDIAKHDPELAQAVVDAGAVPLLAPLVVSPEARLRRNACCALAQIAKHSMDLAEVVVEADLFPRVLTSLKFPDDAVRKCGATVVREIVKHNPDLAQLVVANGGVAALVDNVADTKSNNRLPGIMALGYIGAFSETLAQAIISENGLAPLAAAVAEEAEDHVKSASVWTLGQIGRHTPNHARAVADTGVLLDFVTLEGDMRASEDLKGKCRKALKAILGKLTHLPTLDVLLRRPLPENLMKMVLDQLGRVLANDASGRATFVHSGGLAAAQHLAEAAGGELKEAIDIINSSYPEEVVRHFSPAYSKQLLQKLDSLAVGAAAAA